MIDPFATLGYVRLPRLFPRADLVALQAEVGRAVHAPVAQGCARANNTLVAVPWSDPVLAIALRDHERVARITEAAGATDLRWISAYVSTKDPHSAPLAWHQDWWCWDHPVSLRWEPPQIAVLCYLDATDPEHAALRLLPGSHHRAQPLHAVLPEAHSTDAVALPLRHPALCDVEGQVTVQAAPGDAIVIDYRLLHGTHANATDGRRDCLILTFAPRWSELPEDVKAHLIRHPCLPSRTDDLRSFGRRDLLPVYRGMVRDLPLTRSAPTDFSILEPK